MKQGLSIGELSRKRGISTQTIRYYERIGLLDPPERTQSDYRIYSEDGEERLRFIQKAKQFGLSLEEIKTLIEIRKEGSLPCSRLKAMIEQHLDDLDRRIEEMVEFRQEIADRYEWIEARLPDRSPGDPEAVEKSKICGLIETEDER